MAEYSPIGPIAILEQLHAKNLLGNYLLLLAHDVLANKQRYVELTDSVRAAHDDAFIIMDNSVIELGEPMDILDVVDAANLAHANAIVCPDVLGSLEGTKKKFLEHQGVLFNSGFELVKIPQGANNGELVQCVEWLGDKTQGIGELDLWGIPRWVTNKLGTRIQLVQFINLSRQRPEFHLLGMSRDFEDDVRTALLPGVLGIDSANPVVLGQQGIDIRKDEGRGVPHLDRGDYWEHTDVQDPYVKINIGHVRERINRQG